MIKSINFINYKSFDNLDISDINFENINLIFGYNGHGKSSFADFLYQSINNNILDNFNCSQQKYKIYIYNERYKRNVLYIDDDEKYDFNSFYAGENIKDIIKQKSKIEEKIAKLKIFEDRNEKDRNNVNIQIDNLKIIIAKRTREVLEKINPQAYKTPQSYTKASIQNVQFYNAQLLDSNEFDEIKKLTINNKPNEINIYNFNLIDKVSFNISELNKILKETPENYAIEKFKNDIELENFARTALKIKNNSPQEYNDKCPLCGQSIIQVKLWETLEKHFNKEYDNFVKKLEEYADFFESVKNEVNNFKKWLNENLINSKLMLEKGIKTRIY
ncbi:AAA family ATPase [uncultured Brachyspira sp.]|uniref:AAA family ATPase n=1 Tax=uncultured Brachyspira sp. TaxID=221953 RepID=UPI0025942415|nr:AAA family ATPase [uncultured Brachyspira sp.]